MIRYHTSFRVRPIDETIALAQTYAARLGVSRVTEITRLDEIGIPVCVGIRPDASEQTLCVSAGKGVTTAEARVGAYMEAIEMALSEPRYSRAQVVEKTYRQVLSGLDRAGGVLDLCPLAGAEIPLDGGVPCVEAQDLVTGHITWVPAELAFIPFSYEGYTQYFGCHSNGLASGNTFAEACLHGIFELLERDALSFEKVKDSSALVSPDSWPADMKDLGDRIRKAGLELFLRVTFRLHEMPLFTATLVDHDSQNPVYINSGYGCHPDVRIAARRALTEAVQSRLSFIHGGRDDLVRTFQRFAGMPPLGRQNYFERVCRQLRNDQRSISFDRIPSGPMTAKDTAEWLDRLLLYLGDRGFPAVLAVSHTGMDEPLSVVKIIIPGLEFFTRERPRVGPRLKKYAESIAHHTVRRA